MCMLTIRPFFQWLWHVKDVSCKISGVIGDQADACESSSTISSDNSDIAASINEVNSKGASSGNQNTEIHMLDIYSGCGAMSTGLCLGANFAGSNLVTVGDLF